MKCKICKKELSFLAPVEFNLQTYGGSKLATSNCCGTAYQVTINYKYDVVLYEGDKTEDDWGYKIIKPKI